MKPEKSEKFIIVHGRWSFLYFQKPLIEQDKAPLKISHLSCGFPILYMKGSSNGSKKDLKI